jgi:hypothetical protein
MSQAKDLIFLLKSIDEIGFKQKWNREKLERTKEDAIRDYYNLEQKIHNTDSHHIRNDLNDGNSRSLS